MSKLIADGAILLSRTNGLFSDKLSLIFLNLRHINCLNFSSPIFLAKITESGYQLVNAISGKTEMELFKTAAPNVYTVKGKEAIVFKEGDKWFYSESDTKKELNIKF